MKWKEFLKPDSRKVVIFVILLIMEILLSSQIGYICSEEGCYTTSFPLISFILLNILFPTLTITVPFWILDVFILYLLSCLIVRIYDKLKKK